MKIIYPLLLLFFTSYKYVLGGLMVQLAYEKGDYNLIKTMMSSGKADADFYNTIEKYLGIPQHNLNSSIRAYLNQLH